MNSLPPLECPHILRQKRKPFALLALIRKAVVPVILNAGRIVRFNIMDWMQFLGKLKRYFAFASNCVVCPTNLVFAAGTVFQKVDVTDATRRGSWILDVRRFRSGGERSPQVGDIIISGVRFAI